MVEDARQRTREYLAYLDNDNLTEDDNSTPVTFTTAFARPEYPLKSVFAGTKNVDLVYAVGTPNPAEPIVDSSRHIIQYREKVPIEIYTVNKTGITGTKLRWKAEAELRRVVETYPLGLSIRSLEKMSDNDQYMGGWILYSVKYTLIYLRNVTV